MNANVILVGLGPHAKRIYMNCFYLNKFEPKLIVDVASKKEEVLNYIKENNLSTQVYFIKNENKNNDKLSQDDCKNLIELIKQLEITHMIISTEPKSHKAYLYFAMENDLHTLVDKPLSAPVDVSCNYSQAKKIEDDYHEIKELYLKTRKKNTILQIQCQRRWHKGYQLVHKLASEIVNTYKIPITSIQLSHCDGMWNMPDEFIFRENHPYKYGYGKLFHSGYHFIDVAAWFSEINNLLEDKRPDSVELYAAPVRPDDFMSIINKDDYNKLLNTNRFDEIFSNTEKYSFKNFGEIDIYSIMRFMRGQRVISTVTVNLMQNGFSRRSWDTLPEDTYKGNGRVRHEYMNINIGPLANIQIHSYQSKEIKDKTKRNVSVGEVEHFDILVFRNVDLIGGKAFEKYTLNDLYDNDELMLGYNESAREKCFNDFINCNVKGDPILEHSLGIRILSKEYEALCKQYNGEIPHVKFKIPQNHII